MCGARIAAVMAFLRVVVAGPRTVQVWLSGVAGARSAAVYLAGGPGSGSPAPADVWLYLEPDAEVLAGFAADNEGAAGQMLSGILEFLELLAVPSGYLPVKVSHDVAIDHYRYG